MKAAQTNAFNLKGFFSTNRYMLLALLVLLIYLSPNIFFPHKARFLIHDNLDSNVVWYKNLAESGKMFASNDAIIPNSLGGIPRGCYPAEFNLSVFIYYLFPPVLAYNLNIVLIHVIAFLSMYVFNKRYIFKTKFQQFNVLTSLCFALLPFWPSGGLSIAGQPLLLYAFLNILNHDLRLKNWLILALMPFYSILVFSNLFFCLILFTLFIIYSVYKRKVNFYFVIAFALFALISVAVDYRLFMMQFLEHFESHRSTLNPEGTLNFKGLLGVTSLHFLFGQYHVPSIQFPFALLVSMFGFFVAKTKMERGIILGFGMGAFLISLIYVIPDWKPMANMMSRIPFLRVFQLRFYALFPLIWSVMYAYSIILILQYKTQFKVTMYLLLLGNLSFLFFSINEGDYQGVESVENSFYNSYINQNQEGFLTFSDYYQVDLFKDVKEIIPTNEYVGCIGLMPEVAQYNGFKTIDGYFYLYSKRYNVLLNQISAKEIEKEGMNSIGSRGYLLSKDVNDGKQEITSLELDFEKLRALGTRYIFSDRKIANENLKDELKFSSDSSMTHLFVYTLKESQTQNVAY